MRVEFHHAEIIILLLLKILKFSKSLLLSMGILWIFVENSTEIHGFYSDPIANSIVWISHFFQ